MNILISILILYIGAALGSFLSVVIFRVRHDEPGIFLGRSHCSHCKKLLVAVDLIPIVSYIFLGGRCRYCKQKISPSYIMLELVTGIIFTVLYLKFPFMEFIATVPSPIFHLDVFIEFARYALASMALIAIFFYDLLYQEIPDIFTYTGIFIALIGNLISGSPLPQEFITGAAFGAIFFETQLLVSKGKWVGAGDVILGLLMGIMLGWKLLIVALFISYFIGALFAIWLIITKKATRASKIPFAPFLVTGTILSVLFGSQIIDWYLGILFV